MYNMQTYEYINNEGFEKARNEIDILLHAKNTLVAITKSMRSNDTCRKYIQKAIDSYNDTTKYDPEFVYPRAISMMCDDINKAKKNELQEVSIDLLNDSIKNYIKANKILKERIIELETENEKLQGKNATLKANNIKLKDKVEKFAKLQAETVKGLEKIYSMIK